VADRGEAPPKARRVRTRPKLVSLESYAAVFVLVIVTYVLTVTLADERPTLVLAAQMLTVWLVLHVSRAHRGTRIVATVVLALAALAALVHLFIDSDAYANGTLFLAGGILYAVAPITILRELLRRREVDREVVLGALDAYLLIGMAFAFVTLTVEALDAEPYFGAGGGTVSDHLFFSFTTLTTTGYGNLVPVGSIGQSLAVGEMLMGQLFLITAVAKVIGAWRPARWSDETARERASDEAVPRPGDTPGMV
jgi:hypothetical protein